MSSSKIIIKEQDQSGYVPSFNGVYGAMVHPAKKGRVNLPILTSSETDFIAKRGLPDPKIGTFHYDAFAFFSKSDKLWSVRVTHQNAGKKDDGTFVRDDSTLPSVQRFQGEARFSGALIRSIVKDVNVNDVNAIFSDESMVVKALPLGLVQDELDAYEFPMYNGARTYGDTKVPVLVKYPVVSNNNLFVTDNSSFSVGDMLSIVSAGNTPSQNSDLLTVVGKHTSNVVYKTLTLDIVANGNIGDAIKKVTVTNGVTTYENYPSLPTLIQGASSTLQVIVSDSDLITNGDTIVIGSDTIHTYTVESKDLFPVSEQIVVLDSVVNVNVTDEIFMVIHYEIEQRDAMLVLPDSQGIWGNISGIGTEPSKNYSNAFNLVVYVNGAEKERWNDCSRVHQVDGLGNQMFIEDKINGKSSYIRVVNNELLDDNILPAFTNHSYWRENAVDIFVPSGSVLLEDVLAGDFYVNCSAMLPLGSRIKFGTYSDEYKVSGIANGQLVLDRPFIPSKVPVGTVINVYSNTETKKITKLTAPLSGVSIGATYAIGSSLGTVLDAGVNYLFGGDDGSAITVYDLMMGWDLLTNKEAYSVTLIMDGGFANPALAQKLDTLAQTRDDCFAYISMDPNAEISSNYLNDMIAYRNALMLNSSYSSVFAGWVNVADQYNQLNVYISPVGFAMASQSYTATNYAMWYPAAGWTRGKVSALGVHRVFDETDRDMMVDSQINPIRYKEGSGLVIWGNETTLTLPSALQSRHVRMLLIVIKQGLRIYLEGKSFDLNTERGRSMLEASITAFMRDVIGDGVYGYTVAVNGYTTATDIAQNKVEVFLGIQPTMYMKEFDVNLSIFSANQKIQIA